MTELIDAVIDALKPIIAKLEQGERPTVFEMIKAGTAIYTLIHEYVSRKPIIGESRSLAEGFNALPETAVETFDGEDRLADTVAVLNHHLGQENIEWKPDGHLLKQLIPVLIKLLPLLI